MINAVELSDKDFKTVIIKMFQQATMKILETNKKIESPSKEKFQQRNRRTEWKFYN